MCIFFSPVCLSLSSQKQTNNIGRMKMRIMYILKCTSVIDINDYTLPHQSFQQHPQNC